MNNNTIGRWSLATTNIFKAISKLIRAMKQRTPDSYLAYVPNEKAAFPIKIPNPKLDDPFNWKMAYGVPQAPDKNYKYFNDTVRDLTLKLDSFLREQEIDNEIPETRDTR